MLLSDFDYNLPQELIAQKPVEPRDSARLLVYERSKDKITHSFIANLADFLPEKTLLIANNSKVRKSRLFGKYVGGQRSGKDCEVFLLNPIIEAHYSQNSTYSVMISGKRPQIGQEIEIFKGVHSTIMNYTPNEQMATLEIQFDCPLDEVERLIEQQGNIPLPPYIKDRSTPNERYQTVFSKEIGSAAAPTAGLHFTNELIDSLLKKGFAWDEVTLNVGLGTFLPLRNPLVESNILHAETSYINQATSNRINKQKAEGHRVLAVGTTSVRTIESHFQDGGVVSGHNKTNIFIYPGYKFMAVDCLLTNFHLPKSSLLMLVSAFIGNSSEGGWTTILEPEMIKRLQKIYQVAVQEKYRFFSYGDAMLIL